MDLNDKSSRTMISHSKLYCDINFVNVGCNRSRETVYSLENIYEIYTKYIRKERKQKVQYDDTFYVHTHTHFSRADELGRRDISRSQIALQLGSFSIPDLHLRD